MIIPVDILTKLNQKVNLDELSFQIDLASANTEVPLSKEKKGIRLTTEYIKELVSKGVETLYLYYDPRIEKLLKKHFRDMFGISEKEYISVLKRYLVQYNLANELSTSEKTVFKQRDIILLQEIFEQDTTKKRIIAHYNSVVDEKTLNKITTKYTENFKIKFTYNERGILFVQDKECADVKKELIRAQFLVGKIFYDIGYSNISTVDINKGFTEYFQPSKWYYPKVVLFCGKTTNNFLLYKKLKVFDPFVKVEWITSEDLELSKDEIFDKIISRLQEDYFKEFAEFSMKPEEKTNLQISEISNYREKIAALGRNFNLTNYVDIAYEMQERNKLTDMSVTISHLNSVLKSLKLSKSKVFQLLLNEKIK